MSFLLTFDQLLNKNGHCSTCISYNYSCCFCVSDEIKVEDLLVPEEFDDIPLASISLDISVDILKSIGSLELKE